jgi:hypothetical protein
VSFRVESDVWSFVILSWRLMPRFMKSVAWNSENKTVTVGNIVKWIRNVSAFNDERRRFKDLDQMKCANSIIGRVIGQKAS